MAQRKTQTKRKPRKKKQTDTALQKFIGFMRDERVQFILGVFFLFFALYIGIAFFSYLNTWKADQSRLDLGLFQLITDSKLSVDNMAGNLGAYIAHVFIHKWFGLASISHIFLIVLFSFELIRVPLLPFWRSFRYTLILTIWTSVTLGYLFGEDYFSVGGAHGAFVSGWLNATLGKTSTFFILLITMLAFIIFTFDNALDTLKSSMAAGFKSASTLTKTNQAQTKAKPLAAKATATATKSAEEKTNRGINADLIEELPDEAVVEREVFVLQDDGTQLPTEGTSEVAHLGLDLDEVPDPEISHIAQTSVADDLESFAPPTPDSQVLDGDIASVDIPQVDNLDEVQEKSAAQPMAATGGLSMAVEKNQDISAERRGDIDSLYDPTLDLGHYVMPPVDLLENHKSSNSRVTNEELIGNKNRIVRTLEDFKIKIVKIKAVIGPTVTLYEIVPAPGVRISKIKNLEDDIALSLAALGIRIIAPMPGRGTIGIEVPNQHPDIVSMRSVVSSVKFQESKYELPRC